VDCLRDPTLSSDILCSVLLFVALCCCSTSRERQTAVPWNIGIECTSASHSGRISEEPQEGVDEAGTEREGLSVCSSFTQYL